MFLDDLLGVLRFFRNPARFIENLAELIESFDKEKLTTDNRWIDEKRFYRFGGSYENKPETNILATWQFPWDRPKHG